jgi:Carboxypeptidase regulatory-like domain/TonB dependent receptor
VRLGIACIAFLAAAPSLQAQRVGALSGRVIERLGRPVAQASVRVELGDTVVRQATTDAGGAWSVAGLAPGSYRVTIRRLGYRALQLEARVAADRPTVLFSLLDPAPLTLDTLVVQSPTAPVPTSDVGTSLRAAEISLLPTTLDVRQLIALTPGARPDQIWGGASDQANAYSLDGTAVTHVGLGGALLLPSPTWIETLEVRGLGADADVPGAQGGVVAMTTRDGRNVREGSVRTSFESHQLNGSNLIQGEIGRELARRWEVDAQVRGPLVPDRLHFALFGNGVTQTDMVPNYLPTRSGVFVPDPPSLTDYRGLAKLSGKPGKRDLVQGALIGRHLYGERTGQTGYEDADATTRLRTWGLSANLTWHRSWSATSALTVRAGGYVSRDRHEPYAGSSVPAIEILRQTNPPQYQNAPFRTLGAPSTYQLGAVWVRNLRFAGVMHDVKLGGDYALGSWYFSSQRTAEMTWRPLPVLGFDPQAPATWQYASAIGTAWGGDVRLDSRSGSGALFVQDHFSLTGWLSLNPGIRFGSWSGTLISPAGRHIRVLHDRAAELRLGATVDVDRQHGFALKAHWGRYHQPMFAGLFDRASGADVFTDEEIWSYLGSPPTAPVAVFTPAQGDSLAAAGLFRLDQINRLADAGRVENLRQPYMDQLVVALERDFGPRWKAAALYVQRRNRKMVALVDRNIATNYTVVQNVIVRDRFHQPVYYGGRPLVLEQLAISNEDILYVQELVRQGLILGGNQLLVPPSLTPAQLAALRYEPDLVLTNVPQATRRFKQLQLRLDARYPTWWAGASATFSSLNGNINVVSGPDDYTTGGPGPWVRLNEQFGFYGALNNQSQIEAKLYIGAVLPAGLRGGGFFSFATGDRVAPTMLISGLLSEYAVAVPRASNPAQSDTVPFNAFLFRSTAGHRIFVLPRGTYRDESRSSLDLHLERGFPRGRAEIVVVMDGFNVLATRSVLATQTVVNGVGGFGASDYGRVLGRVPPRTLRLSAGLRF